MPLPFVYPNLDGPGRLTEICNFRTSCIPQEQFDETYNETVEAMSTFPISRRSILAMKIGDPGIAVLIADWTSAEEKDRFEPGERYQGLKPKFMTLMDSANPSFACHHIILPGTAETPACDYYTVSHMTIPQGKQSEAAKAFETYVAAKKPEDLVFLAVASSREDAEVVVCLSGHQREASATTGVQTPEHDEVKEKLAKLVNTGSKYAARLVSSRHMQP